MDTSDSNGDPLRRLVLPSMPWPPQEPRHCLRCGAAGLREVSRLGDERPRPACPVCGAVFFYNVKAVVGTLPVVDDRVLLIRRGIPPRLGTWSYPGGYLELGETVEDGARRETHEETGLHVALDRCLGVFSRPTAGIVVILYTARVVAGEPCPCPEVTDLRLFRADEIPWPDLAFPTTTWGLQAWLDRATRPA
ncbi:MAG: NUDIX hydrolase [Chloroflexi bacterium]|nr:NUDIX hydrolase [Chloroflexota bacterium]